MYSATSTIQIPLSRKELYLCRRAGSHTSMALTLSWSMETAEAIKSARDFRLGDLVPEPFYFQQPKKKVRPRQGVRGLKRK